MFGLLANVSAEKVTAKLGGSRMILRLEPNEEIRKSISVINDNAFSVTIDLSVSGESADSIKLEETNFSLSAGAQKNVFFKVKAPKESGITDTKINVRFTPEDEDQKNGVGLAATVIMMVSEGGSAEESSDSSSQDANEIPFDSSDSSVADSESKSSFSASSLLFLSTGILALILIILGFYAFNIKKKRSGRPRV